MRQLLPIKIPRAATLGAFVATLVCATTAHAAQISSTVIAQVPSQVKNGFQYGLGILFMIGFIWGVINIWGGADRLKKGDADGKMGIVSGIIIAGAAAIMAALFYIFGMSDGALTPQF
jgi:fumarate reductase subunit D